MPADSIVKTLNVIKHVRLSVLPGGIDMAFDSLLLQTAEEGFSNRVDAPMSSTRRGVLQISQDKRVQLADDIALETAVNLLFR